jgi:hypothetical protein
MFFSFLARLVAYLVFIVGVLKVAAGFSMAFGWLGPVDEALQRYAPGAATTGEVINSGFLYAGFGIALGTIAEISFGVRRKSGE